MNFKKRIFDIFFAIIFLIVFALPMLGIALLIKIVSKGPVFYVSDRIGACNKIFKMLKFRTMRAGAPVLATHLLTNGDQYLIRAGKWLRKTSLDELPQLWNVLKGEMSFVGPRPALYNQQDLMDLRIQRGIDKLVPGITGWAQINGRDELSIPDKVEQDGYYLAHCSLALDLKILWQTFFKTINGEGIQH